MNWVPERRHIPNLLSLFRIPLATLMLVFAGNPAIVLAAFLLCGLSDVLDGYLARRWSCQSERGARLDSLADFWFFGSLIAYFFFRQLVLIQAYWIPMALIALVRALSFAINWFRHRQLFSVHTIANKLSGAAIFLGIGGYLLTGYSWFISILLILAGLSAIEELLIILVTKKPRPDIRSLVSAIRPRP